ncbi:uncharacterized protein PHACADRAFT_253334 [Phanerochaete carnosa HHB-10118-sp]|uniref:F-box domain-containing protein n=1 Tax=Phanerochaete carnosa (strain HHB-10118-sp) TaxID=650164 RepID=K5VXK4_PHACS|nr:uncharacterized protein PHACADRAFT_253334 [Phanerochaete carnosa HHB-10118-sp]EKM56288.1 hypothetical protein PHACADRAFT_253334 [Phanerochaete carnosa HHB-10118-sp]
MSSRVKAKASRAAAVPKGARSKTLRSVDTNVSAYDRTDPFTALNTLLRLLVSLPTRLGGCQYRLSPDEHALSLHLLSIVEPFVGVAESQRSFTRQPTELLDAIVGHVDSRQDLLALALSCKRMHAIVFPRHFEYRVIRGKVSSLRLWNHLIVNRSLARNIRVLEVLDERAAAQEVLPSGISTTDTDLESTDDELGLHVKHERFLVSALTRMTTLRSFTWSCNHSPISMEQVWPALLKCRTLSHIEINDNLLFAPGNEGNNSQDQSKKSIVLPELRTVSLKSTKHTYGATKTPSLTRLSTMLNNCPNLEDLTVGYAQRRSGDYLSPVADDLLLCGRWPYLRSLTLTNLWCPPQTGLDVTMSFLAAHANLQVLHLDLSLGAAAAAGPLVLPADALPRLRELRSNRDFASAVLHCPCSADGGRPLEILKGMKLSGSGWDDRFLAGLKKTGASMKRIELAGWNDVEDVRRLVSCVPKLVWLDVGKRANSAPAAASSAPANLVEWLTVLSPLAELTTFHGVRLFYEVSATDPTSAVSLSERSRLRKNEEIASTLVWKCAKLRRVDHWEEGSGKVVVLVRDGEKAKYEVRRVKA